MEREQKTMKYIEILRLQNIINNNNQIPLDMILIIYNNKLEIMIDWYILNCEFIIIK